MFPRLQKMDPRTVELTRKAYSRRAMLDRESQRSPSSDYSSARTGVSSRAEGSLLKPASKVRDLCLRYEVGDTVPGYFGQPKSKNSAASSSTRHVSSSATQTSSDRAVWPQSSPWPSPTDENGFSTEGGFSTAEGGFSGAEGGFSTAINGFSTDENGFSTGGNGFSAAGNGFSAVENGFSTAHQNGFSTDGNGFSPASTNDHMSETKSVSFDEHDKIVTFFNDEDFAAENSEDAFLDDVMKGLDLEKPREIASRGTSTETDFCDTPSPVHTISRYRAVQKKESVLRARIMRQPDVKKVIVKPPISAKNSAVANGQNSHGFGKAKKDDLSTEYHRKKIALQDAIATQDKAIANAQRLLRQRQTETKKMDISENVETWRKLLAATERRRALHHEISRLENRFHDGKPLGPVSPFGCLKFEQITVPLRRDFDYDNSTYYFVCLLKYKDTIYASRAFDSDNVDVRSAGEISFYTDITFNGLPLDFQISFELYSKRVVNVKSMTHNENKCLGVGTCAGLFSKHETEKRDVLSTTDGNFELVGMLSVTLRTVRQVDFDMRIVTHEYPIRGDLCVYTLCEPDNINSVIYRGFLHFYEHIGGKAAWSRFWCVLNGNLLRFWLYPEEELDNLGPKFHVDLKNCVSRKIGPAPKAFTWRQNTIALQMKDGEWHIFAAETKDDVAVWCQKFTECLIYVRSWTSANTPLSSGT